MRRAVNTHPPATTWREVPLDWYDVDDDAPENVLRGTEHERTTAQAPRLWPDKEDTK